MSIDSQIEAYISSQAEPKCSELRSLHNRILTHTNSDKLWFLDGKNEEGKVISNPNIGYGSWIQSYANGKSVEQFKFSISGNSTGISIYVLGLKDKTTLKQKFDKRIGKASITGYCVKFKSLNDLNQEVLDELIRFGLELDRQI